ncbi:MAG: four helix bundle protein [Chloroflexi bacterium]|nr:four helix bundle protein [Chloroflexota bacterium]
MRETYSYRNLIMWNKAQELVMDVIQLISNVPNSWSNAVIVRQIVSSATSISANIAEGHGRFSLGAHKNHLSIARGSAAETDNWANTLFRFGYIDDDAEKRIQQRCNEIIAMLSSKMRKLEQSQQTLHESVAVYQIDVQFNLFDADDYIS